VQRRLRFYKPKGGLVKIDQEVGLRVGPEEVPRDGRQK